MARHDIKATKFVMSEGAEVRTQYGALCWRMHRDRIEVLLITSRDTGRWVIPKGWPMAGMSPDAAAAREAWEEAGVEGRVDSASAGVYSYQKVLSVTKSGTNAVPCAVAVFGLRVSRLLAKFPERSQRRRKWFVIDKAARKVMEPELRKLMLAFVPPKAGVKAEAKAVTPALPAADLADADVQDTSSLTALLVPALLPPTPVLQPLLRAEPLPAQSDTAPVPVPGPTAAATVGENLPSNVLQADDIAQPDTSVVISARS